jgi:uncharacterized membrane protein
MKSESAKKIIDAYIDIFEQMSLRSFKQGFAFVVDSFEERLNTLKRVKTREALEAVLLKEPEPDPIALDAQVDAIRLLPYTIRKMMPEALREFAQTLPHDPGGRPRSLNGKDAKYICMEIGKLIGMGVRLLDAQNRLALRMSGKKGKDVSIRTVQRAWQDRAKWFSPADQNPKSVRERIVETWRGQRTSSGD